MSNEIGLNRNEHIKAWTNQHLPEVNTLKKGLGVKHNRTQAPFNSKAKFGRKEGAIERIGITMSKFEMFSLLGVGPNGNRTPKPFLEPMNMALEELADRIVEADATLIIKALL